MFRIEPYLFRDWENLNKTIRVVLACFYHKKTKLNQQKAIREIYTVKKCISAAQ